jgi:hypothetical protein
MTGEECRPSATDPLRKFAVIAIAAVVTGIVVGVVVAGSGGDSGGTTHTTPQLLPPSGSVDEGTTDRGTTGDEGTTGESTTTTPSTGGAPAQTTPTTPSGGAQTPQNDTQQHDVPPPKGSPAQRFEQFCKDNPGAC